MGRVERKNYFLDTNVLIKNPYCLTDESFADGHINLPETVLTEVEKFKGESSERGFGSREFGRELRKLRQKESLKGEGIKNANGSLIKIVGLADRTKQLLDGWDINDPDHLILKTLMQEKKAGRKQVTLVTNDIYLAIKADRCGIKTDELYFSEQVRKSDYSGQKRVFCKSKVFEQIVKRGQNDWTLTEKDVYLYDEHRQRNKSATLVTNEFLIITNELNDRATRLGRFDGMNIVPLKHEEDHPSGITPRNATQLFMQEALMTEAGEQRLVIFEGAAGTAKTFLTLAVGVEAKKNGRFEKFYVTRANVEADESFGYLPGDIDEKFEGFLNPIYDSLEALFGSDNENFQKNGKKFIAWDHKKGVLKEFGIEPKTLNHMRGRTLPQKIIFVDEAQNLTKKQAKMIVTRAGEGTLVVLSGDITQIDSPKLNPFNNGLTHAMTAMAGQKLCYIVKTGSSDNARSELSRIAAENM